MNTNVHPLSKQSYRERHKRRHNTPRLQPSEERSVSSVAESLYTIKLRRRRRAQAAHSFYDNNEDDENEHIVSKWTIVRQRLPDILALSETYKPTSIRAQLVLLVALMNKQASEIEDESDKKLQTNEYNNTISHIVPSNVTLDLGGRSQIIYLKRIPPDQVIHVDVDGLSFSIPTRQFILAISRGITRETAAKYCPPFISDMLIDISKTKFIDENRQYKRAQVKMRIGRLIFVVVYIFIITMLFAMIIAATETIFKFGIHNTPMLPRTKSNEGILRRVDSADTSHF